MPRALSKGARERTKPLMACFEALYIGGTMDVVCPATEEIWMMWRGF